MPKIPLYEQGRLASSLVGTPGVDNSGQIMAESVATGLSQLNTALAYKQRQTLAAQKELETLQRNAIAAERVSAYDVKANQGYNDVTEKNAFTPDIAMAELPKHLKSLGASALEGVEDPQTKMLIQQKIMEKEAAYIKQASDWKTGRSIPIAEKSLEAQVGDLSQRVRSAVGPDGVVDSAIIAKQFQEFDASTAGISSMLYGPAAGERNRQAKGAALKDVLFDMAAKGPQGTEDDERFAKYLKTVYESPEFQAYMDPADGKQVLVEARRIAAEASRTKEEQKRLVQADTDLQIGEAVSAAQTSGATAPVYRQMYEDAKARNASPAVLSSIRSLEVGLYKKATGEAKIEDKARQVAITKTVVVEGVSAADNFFNRFKSSQKSKPLNPYTKVEGVKALRDYTDAVAKVTQAQIKYRELTGAPSDVLQRKLDKLNAVGRKVQTSGNLKNQVVQYNSFKAAMPTPRFTGTASEVAAKKNQYNRLRDQAFIDHADAGQLDALNNPKKRAAVNVYILKQMGAK